MIRKHYLLFHKDHRLSVAGCNSGAENATLWLARTLVSQGAHVCVAGIIPEGTHMRWGIQFLDLGKNFDTNLAFTHMRMQGEPYHLIAACRAIPILQSQTEPLCLSRSFIAHDPSSGAAGITPAILSSVCDYMICVSEAQKGLFVEAGAQSDKIHVIPNGADLDLFKAGAVNQRNYKKFVFVGALVAHKGIDLLIQAFYNITQQFPDAELHIYGSAGLWGQDGFINESNIKSQVPQITFHGAVTQEQVAEAFRDAGACIIPSRWFDSFPLTAVESLVSGCPVIAFDVGGIREAVQHDKNGLLIPEVSEALLTENLQKVLSQQALLTRFSEYALKHDRTKFTWVQTVTALEKIIDTDSKNQSDITKETQVGFVTTWNQQCGLATYASFLTGALPENSYVIFAEDTQELTAQDAANVTRCWNRISDEYASLKEAVRKSGVSLLHLNCHARFFHYPKFNHFLEWCRLEGIRVVATLHNLFTVEKSLQALLPTLDSIFVHCAENKLEAVANGASPEKVHVIPHGVVERVPLTEDQKLNIRKNLGIQEAEKLITCFGFVQPHKGMEALIEAIAFLRSNGVPAHGLICGKPHDEDPHGGEYAYLLQKLISENNLETHVTFLNRFVDEEEVASFLGASDAILMNYRSQHFEASGACSLAVGAGVPVITSLAPTFSSFGDAVFRATAGYPVTLALYSLLTNSTLYNSLKENATQFISKNNWNATAGKLIKQYKTLGQSLTTKMENNMSMDAVSKRLKILLHNRPNMFSQRGGDTVVVEKLLEGMRQHAVDITVDLEAKVDPKGYDIVHIFNFALPDMVRFYAERAKNAGVPYVVTTLLEDVPTFHYQSHYVASHLVEYVTRLQDPQWWKEQAIDYRAIEAAPSFDNRWAAQNASALFSNGTTETQALKRTYGDQLSVTEVPLGHELKSAGSKEAWEKEFGCSDFVLSVGRIESRKNQLMLLKALEHDDITVVLAAGDFSYQPEYEQAVKQFKRKGKTIILSKLTDQQLANAYAAAKVHALPSWYELPGLVSLEAAHYGCNIVATRNGTSSDYLGNEAFYCDPGDADSIRSAVLAAYYAPRQTNLKEKVMNYSWKEMADKTMKAYQTVAEIKTHH